jgi:hypothetical protein
MIEIHPHPLENLIEVIMILIYELHRSYPLLLGIYNYRGAVRIRATYEAHLPPHFPQTSHKNVCRDIRPEMTDMAWPVGIGQSTGYKNRIAYGKQCEHRAGYDLTCRYTFPILRYPTLIVVWILGKFSLKVLLHREI